MLQRFDTATYSNDFSCLTADTVLPCDGNNNGTITIAVVGGTPPWNYAWSNGDSTLTIMNLSGGLYTITVTDHNGCTNIHSVTFTQPSALVIQIDSHDAQCRDSCNGEVTSAVTGGYTLASSD